MGVYGEYPTTSPITRIDENTIQTIDGCICAFSDNKKTVVFKTAKNEAFAEKTHRGNLTILTDKPVAFKDHQGNDKTFKVISESIKIVKQHGRLHLNTETYIDDRKNKTLGTVFKTALNLIG